MKNNEIERWITRNGVHIPIYKYNMNKDSKFRKVSKLNPNDYKANEYARFLATKYQEGVQSGTLYEYTEKRGKAFLHIEEQDTKKGKIINTQSLGSTGKGVGTKALYKLLRHTGNHADVIKWGTDNKNADKYYSHLGLSNYSRPNVFGNWNDYVIKSQDARIEGERLRDKYRKGGKK